MDSQTCPSFIHPIAAKEMYLIPDILMNHEVTSLSLDGPDSSLGNTTLNRDLSFETPSPSPLDAYTYVPNTQPEALFNHSCSFDTMTSIIQTNFNRLLPVEDYQEPFFQLYESDIPYLEAFLRNPVVEPQNNPCNTVFPSGVSQFGSMRSIVSNGEELQRRLRFKCGECGMAFPTSNALGGHMSNHSKIRKKEALRNMKLKRQAMSTNVFENEVNPPPLKLRRKC